MEYTDSGIHAYNSTLQYTVEWFTAFAIFENGHIAANQEYFYEFNSKKLAKLTAPENRIILGEKFQIPCFHMKKKLDKKKENYKHFILGPKMVQRKVFFYFLFIFSFKSMKWDISLLGQLQKCFFLYWFAHFGVTVKIFSDALCHFKEKYFGLGVLYNNLTQHGMCLIFSAKNTPPFSSDQRILKKLGHSTLRKGYTHVFSSVHIL